MLHTRLGGARREAELRKAAKTVFLAALHETGARRIRSVHSAEVAAATSQRARLPPEED